MTKTLFIIHEILDKNDVESAHNRAHFEAQNMTTFTSDLFTVSPLVVAGGNIGKLAIAGTVNDLAIVGVQSQYLHCSVIIEEWFEIDNLKIIVSSMVNELSILGAKSVYGDIKVAFQSVMLMMVMPLLFHVMWGVMAREGLILESELINDCNTLWPAVEALIAVGLDLP